MNEKCKKFFPAGSITVKAVDEETQTVDALVSTKSKDRDGDIIPPESFKKWLKVFKQHPVMIADHDYQIMKQIGEAVKVSMTEDGLEVKFQYYAGQGNATADWAYILAKKGKAAYSIGFIAHDWEYINEKDEEGREFISGRKFNEIELIEISQVVVPANRDALQDSIRELETRAEVSVLVAKGIDAGEIEVPKPPEQKPSTENIPKSSDEPHYSEDVLEKGSEIDSTPSPVKDDLKASIAEIIKEVLNNGTERNSGHR